MSRYNLEFNKDDSVIRYIIVAFLQDIKQKISFIQKTEGTETTISVPFYYAVSGREDFLYSEFLEDDVLDPDNEKAIGIYDQVPRGSVALNSVEIDSSALVNKFVRMTILKKIENQLAPYSYETSILPITMSFDVKILSNSNIEMLKITETAIRKLYKNNVFYLDLGGYRLSGNYMIPESLDSQRSFEFGFSDKKLYEITFAIEIKSSIPVFEESTEIFAGNVMTSIQMEIKDISTAVEESPLSNQAPVLTDDTTDSLSPTGPPYTYPRIETKDTSEYEF